MQPPYLTAFDTGRRLRSKDMRSFEIELFVPADRRFRSENEKKSRRRSRCSIEQCEMKGLRGTEVRGPKEFN